MSPGFYYEGTVMAEDGHKYLQFAARLRERVAAGEFTEAESGGELANQLPSERELAKEYRTSIETIRRALAVLIGEGQLTVRPGVGTFVRDFTPIFRDANKRLSVEQWRAGHAIWSADLGLRPLEVEELKVERKDAPEWVAQRLGTSEALVRDRVFVVEKRRVQIATSYLPADLVAGSPIESDDTGPGGTFARLGDLGVVVAEFDEDVRARVPSPDEAKRLHLGRGGIVIEIIRNAKTAAGRIVEVNRMILDADAYVLHWNFTA